MKCPFCTQNIIINHVYNRFECLNCKKIHKLFFMCFRISNETLESVQFNLNDNNGEFIYYKSEDSNFIAFHIRNNYLTTGYTITIKDNILLSPQDFIDKINTIRMLM